jgi:hypothetical protein
MTLCVASQRVFVIVILLSTQSGNFWIHLRMGHQEGYSELGIQLG